MNILQCRYEQEVSDLPFITDANGLNAVLGNNFLPTDTHDVAFCLYTGEVAAAEAAPGVRQILDRIAQLDGKPIPTPTLAELIERPYPNIMPHLSNLAGYMAFGNTGRSGGGFLRVEGDYPIILAPAIVTNERFRNLRTAVTEAEALELSNEGHKKVDIRLADSIATDFGVVSKAMGLRGLEPEIIDYRAEPPFPAHRVAQVGLWLAGLVHHT